MLASLGQLNELSEFMRLLAIRIAGITERSVRPAPARNCRERRVVAHLSAHGPQVQHDRRENCAPLDTSGWNCAVVAPDIPAECEIEIVPVQSRAARPTYLPDLGVAGVLIDEHS